MKVSLKQHSESQKKSKEYSQKIESWKARSLINGIDFYEEDIVNFGELSPEYQAVKFCDNWKRFNYGAIARQIHQFEKVTLNFNHEAGKVRKVFEGKILNSFQVQKIIDISPAISEVTLKVNFSLNNNNFDRVITLRLLYKDTDNEFFIHGEEGGQWYFFTNFFHEIELVS